MIRMLALMCVGAVVGGSGAALFLRIQEPGDLHPASAIGRLDHTADESDADGAAPMVVPDTYVTSLATHESVADIADPDVLGTAIERAVAAAPSVGRDIEIKALLTRLAEIDPRRAVDLAQQLAFGDQDLARVFKVWADTEPDAAVARLPLLAPPITQRNVALALLDVFGVDTEGIERIAATFAPAAAMNFRVDAIGKLAERDMFAALAAASAPGMPQEAGSRAQQRIAQTMAHIDPIAAFEQARTIKLPKLRVRYLNSLIDEWAKVDPVAAIAYLEEADFPEVSLEEPSFRALAASGPERLLIVAERFSPRTRTNARQVALEELAALDPVTAYNRVSALAPSSDNRQLIASIADRFAAQDPEAALAWATSLEPPSQAALDSVLGRVAATDPLRAADAVIAEILDPAAASRADIPRITAVLGELLSNGSPELGQIANVLASHNDPRVRWQLDQLMPTWSQADPEGALDWVLRNPSVMTSRTALSIAQQLGRQNPALARQSLQRVAPEMRGTWLSGAANGMAQSDLNAALNWIEGFREEAGYEGARVAALQSGVQNAPETVARLIEDNADLRRQLSANVAAALYQRDPAAAERWVLDLPSGEEQDRGIQVLLQSSANNGQFDTGLFDRLSSDAAREQAVVSSLFALGQTNPGLGRRLIEEHIADPERRAAAFARLDAGPNLRVLSGINVPR